MNDLTIPAGNNAPAKQPAKERPQVGDYLMKIEEVPKRSSGLRGQQTFLERQGEAARFHAGDAGREEAA